MVYGRGKLGRRGLVHMRLIIQRIILISRTVPRIVGLIKTARCWQKPIRCKRAPKQQVWVGYNIWSACPDRTLNGNDKAAEGRSTLENPQP